MSNSNQPVHRLRTGKVGAAIFQNQTAEGKTFYNVQFDRSYRSDGEWKHTRSFGRDDLLVLAKLSDHAHSWVIDQLKADASDTDNQDAA